MVAEGYPRWRDRFPAFALTCEVLGRRFLDTTGLNGPISHRTYKIVGVFEEFFVHLGLCRQDSKKRQQS